MGEKGLFVSESKLITLRRKKNYKESGRSIGYKRGIEAI
jgi:hypothetical protein